MVFSRITDEQIEQARRLLDMGTSGQETARLVGISKRSVQQIRAGKLRKKPKGPNYPDDAPSGPFTRCKCGHKTQKPCRICKSLEANSRDETKRKLVRKVTLPYQERNGHPGYQMTRDGFVFHGSVEVIEDEQCGAVILLPKGECEILFEDMIARRFGMARKFQNVVIEFKELAGKEAGG